MSREVDISDQGDLSYEDLRYLQDRGKLNDEGRAALEGAEPDDEDEDGGYRAMSKSELKAECEARDLPVSGNVDDLVDRLEADDEDEDE